MSIDWEFYLDTEGEGLQDAYDRFVDECDGYDGCYDDDYYEDDYREDDYYEDDHYDEGCD